MAGESSKMEADQWVVHCKAGNEPHGDDTAVMYLALPPRVKHRRSEASAAQGQKDQRGRLQKKGSRGLNKVCRDFGNLWP